MNRKKEFKVGEGKELYKILNLSKGFPWWIRWNPIAILMLTFYEYRRYIDLMDEEGNVRRIYEKVPYELVKEKGVEK